MLVTTSIRCDRTERSKKVGGPARCVAVGLVLAACASLVAAQQVSSLEEATAIAEQLVAQRIDPLAAALHRVSVERTAIASSVGEEGQDETPAMVERYARSVHRLGKFPRPETLGELTAAAHHAEPRVRLAAMEALREGASMDRPGSPALLAARSMITGDQDPQIRRAAFEAYSRWGDQDDVLELARSLGRTAGPVRDLAVREWLRIETERGN